MVARASNVLERMLGPVADCLTPESAQRILQLKIDPDTRSRIDELASKANEGTLTDAEQSEYMDFVDAIDFVGILQAKARQILIRPTGS